MHQGKKSVLYLTYDGLTDPLGQSQILPYLCGLASHGYAITIISFEKEKAFEKNEAVISQICQLNKLEWRPLRYHKKPPVLSTLFDLWTLRKAIAQLSRTQHFEIVHCRSYLTALVGRWVKRRYLSKFIFDMRGFWADERIEGGIWNINNPFYRIIYKYFKRQERELLQAADAVIVLTQSAKMEIDSWGKTNLQADVIPCCVDIDHFDPGKISNEEKTRLKTELGLAPNEFVLLYLGSLGTWYLYEEMLRFFKAVKSKRPQSKFLILTQDRHVVQADSDIIVKTVSRKDVPLYVSVCNASVCFIKPVFSKKGSSATKMGEILAMNVPVFANSGWGDVETLYKEYRHLIVDLHLPFATQLNLSNTEYSYRELALEFFDLEKGIEKYKKIYDALSA